MLMHMKHFVFFINQDFFFLILPIIAIKHFKNLFKIDFDFIRVAVHNPAVEI